MKALWLTMTLIACTARATEDPMAIEFFGDGRDGDFTLPLGATYTMTRDMYWRDLRGLPGGVSQIDPAGFVIHVSRSLIAPSDVFGTEGVYIAQDGASAAGPIGGSGVLVNGTISQGSGGGASGSVTTDFPNTDASALFWSASRHPGNGGSGGSGLSHSGGIAIPPTSLTVSDGSFDLLNAIRMRINGTLIYGGAGGAAGGGSVPNGARGGGGGGGGGNIVLLARQIVNPNGIVVSARGGDGGQPDGINAGGGGGGGGGNATVVVYRLPYPLIQVDGGDGNQPLGGVGTAGANGQAGSKLTFCFVL